MQTFLGDEIGTIVNTVTPIVASVLQGRGSQQPYGSFQPGQSGYGQGFQQWQSPYQWQGGLGQQGGFGQQGFGQHGQFEQIAQLVSAVLPPVLMSLQQSRLHQPFQSGFQFQQPYQGLPPYELAQLVQTVTPIVASLIQSRSYQGHFGQFMPRAA